MNDADCQPPFALGSTLNRLTVKLDRPVIGDEEKAKLEPAMTRKD